MNGGHLAARLALAAVAAVAVLAPVSPVSAHASLQSSEPAANAVLEQGPAEIRLDFDESVEVSLASIELFDGDGSAVALGPEVAGADDTQVTAAVPELGNGLFAVVWRVASTDGHVVDGAFVFQIGTGADGDSNELLDRVRGAGADTGLAVRYGVARFLSLVGAMVLIGGGFWALRRPVRLITEPRAQLVLGASAVAFVVGSWAAFTSFAAQIRDGRASSAFQPSAWGDALHTLTGQMLLLRGVLSVVVVVLLARQIRRPRQHPGAAGTSARARAAAGVLLSVAVVLSFSASGHANAVSPRWWWVWVDGVHLVAAAVWFGGVVVVWSVPRGRMAEPECEHLARRFSAAATVAVPLVVVTGAAQGMRLSGGVADVTATDWGRLLLVKAVLVAFIVTVAAVTRRLLQREGAGSVRRTVALEAVVGVVIIGLVAALVAQPPRAEVPSAPYEASLAGSGLIASVAISPGRVGANEIHVVLAPSGGSLTRVVDLTARVSLPSEEVPLSPVSLVLEGPNHFSGTVLFGRQGEWTLELIVEVTDTQTVLLKSTVPIP